MTLSLSSKDFIFSVINCAPRKFPRKSVEQESILSDEKNSFVQNNNYPGASLEFNDEVVLRTLLEFLYSFLDLKKRAVKQDFFTSPIFIFHGSSGLAG